MGINATGRIIENERKHAINIQVTNYERRKKTIAKKSFTYLLQQLTYCSQCKRKMQKKIADLQIQNKRENAPICIACIMGVPRRKKKDYSKYRNPETNKALKKFKQQRIEYIKNKK